MILLTICYFPTLRLTCAGPHPNSLHDNKLLVSCLATLTLDPTALVLQHYYVSVCFYGAETIMNTKELSNFLTGSSNISCRTIELTFCPRIGFLRKSYITSDVFLRNTSGIVLSLRFIIHKHFKLP